MAISLRLLLTLYIVSNALEALERPFEVLPVLQANAGLRRRWNRVEQALATQTTAPIVHKAAKGVQGRGAGGEQRIDWEVEELGDVGAAKLFLFMGNCRIEI
jgi:hypothetical protein